MRLDKECRDREPDRATGGGPSDRGRARDRRTPKGSRNKFKYEPDTNLFMLDRVRWQERGQKRVRNDRLIGISLQSLAFREWKSLSSAGPEMVRAIEQFFISYNLLRGRQFHPLSRGGPGRACTKLSVAITHAETVRRQGRSCEREIP